MIPRNLPHFFLGSCVVAVFAATASGAQTEALSVPVVHRQIVVSGADSSAASNLKSHYAHAMAANLPGASVAVRKLNAESDARLAQTLPNSTPKAPLTAALASPYFYPADLTNGYAGAMPSTVSHAVYLNLGTGSIATNWGNPEQFLRDLGASTFLHMTDQYTKLTTANRYTVGGNVAVSYNYYGNTIYEHDIWAIIHAAAKVYGVGSGHTYHVFLKQGVDTCFDQSTHCYSPDNSNNFYFCAYHSAVQFSDIGAVFYSVEPYQLTPGCQVATPSPNSQLIDSTNSVLSHEFFEIITDPIPGAGFTNQVSTELRGEEIGDECHPLGNGAGSNLAPTFLINNKKYEVQLEYSNTYHACVAQP